MATGVWEALQVPITVRTDDLGDDVGEVISRFDVAELTCLDQ
jgi:hypothetical protein